MRGLIYSDDKPIKRLGIYCFCDKDGMVDDYNLYLLNDLKENLHKLLVVCNGEVTPEGKARFETVAGEVLVRECFDWERLCQYDEIVLLDSANFGPVYPLREMFDSMNRREADFWGIVAKYNPDCVPPVFVVIRKNLLGSPAFRQYWENMSEFSSFEEAGFIRDFAAQGFKYALYLDTEDLKEYCDDPLMQYPLELVKNRRCPVFGRKSFCASYDDFFRGSCGQATAEFYEYLRSETSYDVNLIWDNLLRTANMTDIKDRMQLNYILPQTAELKGNEGETSRIALLLHVYNEDQVDWCFHYANHMPQVADVYVTTDSDRKKQLILERFNGLNCGKLQVNLVKNRGRDVSALLIDGKDIIKNYDYVCFAHDKKSRHFSPLSIGHSFAYKCFQNILASREYVGNVVRTFANNPRLGLLVPPPPQHGPYAETIGNEWTCNFDNTVKLAGLLSLHVDIDSCKAPVAPHGGMFWFRPRAMLKLFAYPWRHEDFPEEPSRETDGNVMHAIERIFPFVAQDAGYYSGWLLSEQFARLEITNLNYLLRDTRKEFGLKNDWLNTQAKLADVYDSRSWRLTMPLRWITSLLRRC